MRLALLMIGIGALLWGTSDLIGIYERMQAREQLERTAREVRVTTHPNGVRCYSAPINDQPQVICWKAIP